MSDEQNQGERSGSGESAPLQEGHETPIVPSGETGDVAAGHEAAVTRGHPAPGHIELGHPTPESTTTPRQVVLVVPRTPRRTATTRRQPLAPTS